MFGEDYIFNNNPIKAKAMDLRNRWRNAEVTVCTYGVDQKVEINPSAKSLSVPFLSALKGCSIAQKVCDILTHSVI